MGLVMDVISAIRNIRGEVNIAPSKKVNVRIFAPEAEGAAVVAAERGHIVNLANLQSLEIDRTLEEPKGAATGVVGGLRIFVLLEGVVDIGAERARLQKELAKVNRDLEGVARKLANRDFLARAAAAVVQKEERKHRDLTDKHQALEAALKRFADLG